MAKRLLLRFHRYFCFSEFYARVRTHLAGVRFDVYHAHDLNTLPIAWWLARRHDAALVYDSHEYYLERNRAKPYSRVGHWWRRRVEQYLVRAADLNITVNDTIAAELGKRYGVDAFRVIKNTPSKRRVEGDAGSRDLRLALKIPGDAKVLLYLGAVTFNRGLERIIDSLSYLSDCHLVLMGPGGEAFKAQLTLRAEASDVANRFHFFGPVPSHEVTSYACTADVGLAPIENVCLSYYYCSPNKVYEYISSGLPVVASDFPELRKVVLDYEVGVTFDLENVRDIADKIRYVLDTPGFRESVQAKMQSAVEVFNWENEGAKLLEYYAQLPVQA